MDPGTSPWGKIDWMETLAPGIDMIGAEGHGGIMVSREASFMLTPAARKYEHWQGGYLCFEAYLCVEPFLRDSVHHRLIRNLLPDFHGLPIGLDQTVQKCSSL